MADRFWVGGTANWDTTPGSKWSATSGGAGGASVPTSSDDVFIDANSGSGTVSVPLGPAISRNLNFTGFTGTFSASFVNINIHGSLTLVSGMTYSPNSGTVISFLGTGSHTITSAGKTHTGTIIFNVAGGVWTLQDALNNDSNITLTRGTLTLNNQDLRASVFASNNSNVRTLSMGSGTITLTGTGTVWDLGTVTNLTLTRGTSTIKITNSSATAKTFTGGGRTYHNLWIAMGASTADVTITSSNTFNQFKDDGTGVHRILFTAGTTQTITDWQVSGNPGQLISIRSTSTATHALVKAGGGHISADYLDIQHSVATPLEDWYAGANSVDNQAVPTAGSGWIFTVPYTLTTYHVDGHVSITDTAGVWTDDANAFNGSIVDYAYTTSTSAPGLEAIGTTAPTSGGGITLVRGRIVGIASGMTTTAAIKTENASGEEVGLLTKLGNEPTGDWFELTVPADGWTWSKINSLYISLYRTGRVAPDADATASKIDIEVTSFANLAIANYYFDGHIVITDSDSNWTNDSNAFNGNTDSQADGTADSTKTSDYLLGEGTTAPSSGAAITQVRARGLGQNGIGTDDGYGTVYSGSEELGTFASEAGSVKLSTKVFTTLTAPTGGWTWSTVQELKVRRYGTDSSGFAGYYTGYSQIEVTSDAIELPSSVTAALTYVTYSRRYSRETNASLPTTAADLSTIYSASDITDVDVDDGTRVAQIGGNADYVLHQFRQHFTSTAMKIVAKWNGQSDIAPSTATVHLQVYNYTSTTWETVDSDTTTGANTDFTLEGVVSTSVADYYDSNTFIAVRVYQLET